MSHIANYNHMTASPLPRPYARQQGQLAALRERASFFARTTGVAPMNFNEFLALEQSEEPAVHEHVAPIGMGAAVGAGVCLIGICMAGPAGISLALPLAFSGAIAGGTLGAFYGLGEPGLEGSISRYEHYLAHLEEAYDWLYSVSGFRDKTPAEA